MSKRLEALRKKEITVLIIKSIGLFIISIMLLAGAFIVKNQSDDNNVFILLITLAIFTICVIVFNIIYEYRKFLKRD